jgi:hypothetical protein
VETPGKAVDYTPNDITLPSNGLVNLQMNFNQHESLFGKQPHDAEQILTTSSLLLVLLSPNNKTHKAQDVNCLSETYKGHIPVE